MILSEKRSCGYASYSAFRRAGLSLFQKRTPAQFGCVQFLHVRSSTRPAPSTPLALSPQMKRAALVAAPLSIIFPQPLPRRSSMSIQLVTTRSILSNSPNYRLMGQLESRKNYLSVHSLLLFPPCSNRSFRPPQHRVPQHPPENSRILARLRQTVWQPSITIRHINAGANSHRGGNSPHRF